jgi:hypothetical protein
MHGRAQPGAHFWQEGGGQRVGRDRKTAHAAGCVGRGVGRLAAPLLCLPAATLRTSPPNTVSSCRSRTDGRCGARTSCCWW